MHKHFRIYTASGSIYLLCLTEQKWAKISGQPNEKLDHLEMKGPWSPDTEAKVGEIMTLERFCGNDFDKYNPKTIYTTPVVNIEPC